MAEVEAGNFERIYPGNELLGRVYCTGRGLFRLAGDSLLSLCPICEARLGYQSPERQC